MTFILTSLGPLVDRLTMVFDERHDFLHDFVVVQAGDTDHYVQFAFFKDVIYAEAVADHYLTGNGAAPLTRIQRETLERLGWSAPAHCDPDTGSRHNYFREWFYDTLTQTLVMDIWRTVTSVYMGSEGQGIEIYWSSFESDEASARACRSSNGVFDECAIAVADDRFTKRN